MCTKPYTYILGDIIFTYYLTPIDIMVFYLVGWYICFTVHYTRCESPVIILVYLVALQGRVSIVSVY